MDNYDYLDQNIYGEHAEDTDAVHTDHKKRGHNRIDTDNIITDAPLLFSVDDEVETDPPTYEVDAERFKEISLPYSLSFTEIENLLSATAWRTRAAAVRALARFEEQVTAPMLMAALQDTQKAVRVAALETCADLALRMPVKLVEYGLADEEWSVRAAAVWALAQFGDRAPRKRIAAIADDTDEALLTRVWALHSLSVLGDSDAIHRLLDILNSHASEDALREIAAIALGALGEAPSALTVQVVATALQEDRDAFVRAAAAYALSSMGNLPNYALHILHSVALFDKDTSVREAASWTLATLAKKMLEMIEHGNKAARDIALQNVHSLRDHLSEQKLVSLLSHTNIDVRQTALQLLNAPDEELFRRTTQTSYKSDNKALQTTEPLLQRHKMSKSGKSSFVACIPAELKGASLPQVFDGRWIPRALLSLIMENKLSYRDIAAYITKLVRTEYIRSLIHNRKVVIPVSLLYSSPIFFTDALPNQPDREAFKWLLNTCVIIPWLQQETKPDQPPLIPTSTRGFDAWQLICQEACMACVRFPEEEDQSTPIAPHAQAFTYFLISIDPHTVATNFFEEDSAKHKELRNRLLHLLTICRADQKKNKNVAPEDLYREFVIEKESYAREHRYDSKKASANEMKQIIDAAYNASLAHALQCRLLTPADSLSVTTLQQRHTANTSIPSTTAKNFILRTVISLIKQPPGNSLFGHLHAGSYLKSLRMLHLQDVVEIREMNEWEAYMQSLDALFSDNSDTLIEQLAGLHKAYTALVMRITNRQEERIHKIGQLQEFRAHWIPIPELLLNVAGALLTITWTREGPFYGFSGLAIPDTTSNGDAPFTARFSIGTWQNSHSSTDLSISFDFMQGWINAAQKQWKDLKKQLNNPTYSVAPAKMGPNLGSP